MRMGWSADRGTMKEGRKEVEEREKVPHSCTLKSSNLFLFTQTILEYIITNQGYIT